MTTYPPIGFLEYTLQPGDRNSPPEQCPCQKNQTGDPIDTRTGQSWTTATDLMVPGPGPDLVWDRAYVTRNTALISNTVAPLGVAWQHAYGERIFTDPAEPSVVSILTPKGNRFRYLDQGDGTFESFPGIFNTLVQANGVYTQTFRSHEQRVFDATTGRLTDIYDADGGQLHLTYTSGKLTQIADMDASHRRIDLAYTGDHITDVQDGVGRMVAYTYITATNDLQQVVDVAGRPTTYHYQAHLLTGIDNALGQPLERTNYDMYTPAGKAISQTLLDGRQLNLSYAGATTVVTTTTPTGEQEVETFVFGPQSTLSQRFVNGILVQNEGTDANFAPATRTDSRSNQSHTTYNDKGQPLVIENALGQRTTFEYDARSNPITITDTLGRKTVYVYDLNNQVTRQTTNITTSLPLGITTIYTYSTQFPAQRIAEQQPTGLVNTSGLDATGQVITTTLGVNTSTPQISVVEYDPTIRGRVLRHTSAYGSSDASTTQFAYDALGRVVTTTLDLNTVVQRRDITRYNLDDSVSETILNYENGVYNPAAPDTDIITAYGYDALGRQVWVRDALGHYDVTHYDLVGRVDWTLRNLWPISLDGQGAPILPTTPPAYSGTQPDANVATLTAYDGLGRTTLVTQTGILTGGITLSNGLPTFTGTTTRVTRTQYDSLSRPITVTQNYQPAINGGLFNPAAPDVNLQTITQYDADGNIILERDTTGRWTFTEFDALNRPVTVTLNYENGTPLTVDSAHAGWDDLAHTDIVQVSRYTPDGRLEQTIENYVAPGLFTATAPITNRITVYQYDIQGRVMTTTLNYDPATLTTRTDTNLTSATAFDLVTGWQVGRQDASGRWTHMDYDAFGRVTQTIANCRTTTGIPTATACAAFNPQGRLDRNVPSLTRYDDLGRPEETEDALGHVTRTTTNRLTRTTTTIQNYIPNTAPTTTTNVLSMQTVDALGRTILLTDTVVTTTTMDYRVTRSSYDALGRMQSTITPVGTTYYGQNALGNTVVMTDTAGRVTRSGYDGTGTLRWQQRHDGQLTIAHVDGMGRVTTTIQNYQNGMVDSGEPADQDIIMPTRYDAAGRQVLTTDAGRRSTAYTYTLLDQLASVTENAMTGTCVNAPCNVPTQYQYDRMGNRTAIIDALSRVRRFTYDAAGRQVTATDAANVTTAWSYDKLGRTTLQDDPRGASYDLQFAYDELDRITQTLALNLSTPITAQYDALGQRTQLVDSSGTTTFAYNPLGYLTTVGRTDGTVGYAYTSRGERTRLRYPDGASIDYAYDGVGRLQQVQDATSTLATYGYDAVGRLATLTRVNGAATTYGYDAADRQVRQTTQAGTTVLSDFQYQLTAAGQRTVVTETLPLLVGQNGANRAAASGAATTSTWLPTMLQGGSSTPAVPAAPVADRQPAGPPAPAVDRAALAARLADAPLSFVPNRGQTNPAVQFHAQSAAGTVFFTDDTVVFALPTPLTRTADRHPIALPDASAASQAPGRTTAVHMAFRAAGSPTITGIDALPGTVHYLRGKNQAQWQQNLPTYGGVRYAELYPNISASFTGTAGLLKSTYSVSPTGNPSQIRWHYPEATDVRLDAQGDLTITIADAAPGQGRAPERAPITLRESAPVAWQVIAGQQVPVAVAYTLTATRDIGFVVGAYDPAAALIIDPSLTYSTALGGGAADYASALTVDASGNTYMTGSTASIDFPDLGTLSGTRGTGMDAFVTKIGPTGGGYSFYLGGSGSDVGYGITVDASGNAYVIGSTDSTNFPVSASRYQGTRAGTSGTDVFVTKVNAAGTALAYSTYVGGTGLEAGRAIAVDGSGDAYLTGSTTSANFPVLSPRQTCPSGTYDAFLTKLNSTGTALGYSTCVGGSSSDIGYGIGVDSSGNATMVGTTTSTNYPTTTGVHRATNTGTDMDTIVSKISANGGTWVYSTYLGGDSDDQGLGIALDASGAATVVGYTESTNFPTVSGARTQSALAGTRDAFVTRLNTTGTTLLASTYHGGSGLEFAWAVAQDSSANIYITGSTTSSNFPTQAAYQATNGGGEDAYVTKFNSSISQLLYSTYLGGTGQDAGRGIGQSGGAAAILMDTTTPNLPATGGLLPTSGGGATTYHAIFTTAGTSLTRGGYLGGTGSDEGSGITVDSAGNAYVTGTTFTANFPTATPIQGADAGSYDAFVSKVNPSGALIYSTYLGGSTDDRGKAIAVDSSGNAIVVGSTASANFPLANARQPSAGGGNDGFVAKLNSTGTALVYSTYHGSTASDTAYDVAIDSGGNAYVVGRTESYTFPVTAGAAQTTHVGAAGSPDGFITKFSPTGAMVYGTYLGGSGSDWVTTIAVDSSGNAYVAGSTSSTAFPTLTPRQATLGGGTDAFVTKLNAAGSALLYSTYHGGAADDAATGIAVDSTGKATIAGYTASTTTAPAFPLQNALQTTYGGATDAFVSQFAATGQSLTYSTYLGGAGSDRAYGVALDSLGNAYVTGSTASTQAMTPPFPITNAVQPTYGGGTSDLFMTVVNAAGTAQLASTYLGGSLYDSGAGIAVDSTGAQYLTGTSSSLNFPGQTASRGYDALVVKLAELIAPTAPTNLAVAQKTDTGIGLTWTAATDNVAVTSYELYQGTTLVGTSTSPSVVLPNLTATTGYALTVKARDAAGNPSPASAVLNVTTNASVAGGATGHLLREWWLGISGEAVSLLTGNARYPNSPDGSSLLTSFEAPTDWAETYGARLRGYLHPTVSGSYTFWIASDDQSELWLSPDGNPATKVKIASVPVWTASRQWTKYAQQQSAPITLEAGQKYSIEALHKEGVVGDNLAVAWLPPGGTQAVIPGSALSAATAAPDLTAPSAPTNLQAPAIGTTSVTLTWTLATDNVAVSSYLVYQGTTLVGVTSTPSYVVSTLNPSTHYTFVVKARDASGNWSGDSAPRSIVTAVATEQITTSYGYDGLRRLSEAERSSGEVYTYTYDLVGNRLSAWEDGAARSWSYTAADQVVGWSYDAAGNLTNDGSQTYTYNALNQLTTHTPSGGITTTYQYNGDGVLLAQTLGTTTTHFTQDLQAPLSQMLEVNDGTTTTQYIYGYERLAEKSGSIHTWPVQDALGSVRATLDDTGLPLTSTTYDPWGQPTSGAQPNPFGFTGEYQNQGLVYLRARWYQPGNGRFTGRDPFAGWSEKPYSVHTYQYGDSDPVRNIDPTGKWSCDTIQAMSTCADLKTKLLQKDPIATQRLKDPLAVFYSLLVDRTLPGGKDGPQLPPESLFRSLSPVEQRIEFLLWATANGPGRVTNFDVLFSDEGFNEEFRDADIWSESGNQVGHFLTAVNLAYTPRILTDGFRMSCVIGHEMSADGGITTGFTQCYKAGVPEQLQFLSAIHFDIAGDKASRDCILREMLPGLPEAPTPDMSRYGNSLQDIRLSLKGWRFGKMIDNGEFPDLQSAATWMSTNLR